MLKPGTGPNVVKLAEAPSIGARLPGDHRRLEAGRQLRDSGRRLFQIQRRAEGRADRERLRNRTLLADARIIIDTQKMNNGSKLYRARVAGLSKTDAQTACRNLKAKRTDCLVLKIDPTLAMGN